MTSMVFGIFEMALRGWSRHARVGMCAGRCNILENARGSARGQRTLGSQIEPLKLLETTLMSSFEEA